MKFKTFLVYSGLFVGVFTSSMTGYISGTKGADRSEVQPAKVAAETPSDKVSVDTEISAEKAAKISKEAYILRENENKISLFIQYSNGDEQIHSEYDIAVNLLPQSDRERLREGIEFDSVDDVIRFIEDYMG